MQFYRKHDGPSRDHSLKFDCPHCGANWYVRAHKSDKGRCVWWDEYYSDGTCSSFSVEACERCGDRRGVYRRRGSGSCHACGYSFSQRGENGGGIYDWHAPDLKDAARADAAEGFSLCDLDQWKDADQWFSI